MVLDHPLIGPGLRARLQAERGVEVETVFAFDMRANESGIGNALGLVDDIGQLPLGGTGRPCLLLAIGKTGHLELDFGLGHKRADFGQAKSGAEAVETDHMGLPKEGHPTLATSCCHRGVSSGDAACTPGLAAAPEPGKPPLRGCP